MEEFRRSESEFKNDDVTVQFKIAHSVFNILTSGLSHDFIMIDELFNKKERTKGDWNSEWIVGEMFGATIFGFCMPIFFLILFVTLCDGLYVQRVLSSTIGVLVKLVSEG
ncbi:hypothetical protein BLNAU_6731 [Blattamonas nauphoetae]|uniref:Uncharacterized protein n=1 Tax=Blattamonas nauphoetae TaxID=2049346 RepID=A0ABQ9Y3E6_9EUKA|nr:hypothetical protein BLNAU_6731 [Blattamonas nauphoetae]